MNNRSDRRNRPSLAQAGFTLVEIMVVIVILGLLATMVMTNVIGMSDDAKIQKAQTDVKSIYEAARLWRVKNSTIPTMEQLTTEDEKGKVYLEMVPLDPWDNEYMIRETENRKFEVISMGPDGSEGTEDDISSNLKREDR